MIIYKIYCKFDCLNLLQVFAVVEDADTILMHDGEELDSWSVIINGHVEVTHPDGSIHQLHLGDRYYNNYDNNLS